jgi:iron complex outermembrane receptor protein
LRYAMTPQLEVRAGIRHFSDLQTETQSQVGLFAPATPEPVPTGKFISNNPELSLSYKASADGLVYASAAKGFRSGGSNSPPNFGHPTFGPESLWTYTLGTKQEWFDRRLSVDLSGYYNRWINIQAIGLADGAATGYYANVGKASGPGVDFSLRGKLTTELSLSATLGYADMHYDTQTTEANPGDPVNLEQKWTYSIAADYRRTLTQEVRLISRLDYQYGSGFYLFVRDFAPGVRQTPSRHVLNARLGVDLGQWQVYLVGSNLTDNNSPVYPAFGAYTEPLLPAPRTIGVEAKVNF